MQQPDRIRLGVVGAKGVRANELGEAAGLVRGGAVQWAHLVQRDGHAALRDLPGGFGAGEPAADDVDGLNGCHRPWIPPTAEEVETARLRTKRPAGRGG